jgi:flagellin-specific chaperone FliS
MEDKHEKSSLILVERFIHIIELLKKIIGEEERWNKSLIKLYTFRKLIRCDMERAKIMNTIHSENSSLY